MIVTTLVYFSIGMAYETKTLVNDKAQIWNLGWRI
jgi:hypothetical protein